jgi:hypothetical protein
VYFKIKEAYAPKSQNTTPRSNLKRNFIINYFHTHSKSGKVYLKIYLEKKLNINSYQTKGVRKKCDHKAIVRVVLSANKMFYPLRLNPTYDLFAILDLF